jgi:hypothetical protein
MSHRIFGLAGLLTACLIAAPGTALAAEGSGVNIRHLKNIPFPNLNAPEETNAGTDLEFATITIPVAEVVEQVTAPVKAVTKPATKKAAKRKATKRKSRCRKVKGRKARKRCEARERARARARARAKARKKAKRRDAQPNVPGLQRTFSFAGSYGDGLHVIDVTEAASPVLVATWNCGISQGDVQVFQRKDLGGRWFATFTQDDGYDFHASADCAKDLKAKGVDVGDGSGTYIADVTDPYHPKTVSFMPFGQGSHNMTVHPSGKWLYNSNSDLITSPLAAVEIADITDIDKPKDAGEIALMTFPGLGTESHDISFNADGTRAYVAAISHAEILDTSDPSKPVSIGQIVDPAINVWHETDSITIDDPVLGERDFLIAEDEFAGATGTGQCPNGGVHVYDITGDLELAPVKVGAWNITDTGLTEDEVGRCTAHVFQLHRSEQLMTIAYYNAGVRVVDLTGLVGVALGGTGMGMKELGSFRFPDSDTWAAKAPVASRKGFVFYGNDHRRGFDAYEWKPSGINSSPGIWRTPEQTLQSVNAANARGQLRFNALCLLNRKPRSELAGAVRRAGQRL